MLIYWFMLSLPILGVLAQRQASRPVQWLAWGCVGALFAVIAGLRDGVGCDWGTYLTQFESVSLMSFVDAMAFGDPAYYALNWFVGQAGGSVYLMNLICAALVMTGLIIFCRRQPRPWLAFLVAVPYLLIVVAMGYTRQSVALGFALIGLVALGRERLGWFVFWVLVGALFHKSAVLLLPIAALASTRRRLWNLFWVGIVAGLGALLLVGKDSEALWQNYVVADYQSSGGLIRVLMNAVPAAVFLLFRRRLAPLEGERMLWTWMSIFALVCIPLVVMSSTAVDRVALYFIPVQMYVFSRVPSLAASTANRTLLVVGVISYYVLVQAVWLNFAVERACWVPYHFVAL